MTRDVLFKSLLFKSPVVKDVTKRLLPFGDYRWVKEAETRKNREVVRLSSV